MTTVVNGYNTSGKLRSLSQLSDLAPPQRPADVYEVCRNDDGRTRPSRRRMGQHHRRRRSPHRLSTKILAPHTSTRENGSRRRILRISHYILPFSRFSISLYANVAIKASSFPKSEYALAFIKSSFSRTLSRSHEGIRYFTVHPAHGFHLQLHSRDCNKSTDRLLFSCKLCIRIVGYGAFGEPRHKGHSQR